MSERSILLLADFRVQLITDLHQVGRGQLIANLQQVDPKQSYASQR